MNDAALVYEDQVRKDLTDLLLCAVEASGRSRCDIARSADLHKDALRRTLAGTRSASLGEAMRILSASGVPPHAHLVLLLVSNSDQATDWLRTDLALFFGELISALPVALERVLGNQLHDVKPRWAKGAAHRIARLLADHIDELERKDALLSDIYAGGENG